MSSASAGRRVDQSIARVGGEVAQGSRPSNATEAHTTPLPTELVWRFEHAAGATAHKAWRRRGCTKPKPAPSTSNPALNSVGWGVVEGGRVLRELASACERPLRGCQSRRSDAGFGSRRDSLGVERAASLPSSELMMSSAIADRRRPQPGGHWRPTPIAKVAPRRPQKARECVRIAGHFAVRGSRFAVRGSPQLVASLGFG
jgi:hypothetical protein